ncbi:MAG: cytochrome ubiquinol oxidase subunit I [Desulfofustis sp. PB-SRB1]|nr:cytochrome ubiquinol oxidase subunit I [Desulfofustis sp. PB-SRB1]
METVIVLSRLQFAFTVMFHYIFPPLTIGWGSFSPIWKRVTTSPENRSLPPLPSSG